MRVLNVQIHTIIGTVSCLATLFSACSDTHRAEPPPADAAIERPAVSQRFVGCVGPTGDPKKFVLSVAEGRDFTTGEPPGTPIPETSALPEGSPPPKYPTTATTGTPGGGPTPTTRIVTYTLLGDGGKNLRDYVGHTVAVLGTREPADSQQAASVSGVLYVTSLENLADHCK